MTGTILTASRAEAEGFVVDRTCYPWFAYKGHRFAPDEIVEIITEAHVPGDGPSTARPADFFTTVDAPRQLRLPSPVHHEDNPLCSCIPAYLERDLTDPQCPLDVAVEAVEAATGLQEHQGVWGPPQEAEGLPGLPRHTEAILAGDRSARITFRPARTDMVASDLWDPDEMPEHPTADDVAALVATLGRDEAFRLWALAETVTVTVSGPDVGEFTSTTIS